MRVRGSVVDESMQSYQSKITEPEGTYCSASSSHLGKLGKGAVGQHGDVTQQLVDAVAKDK